MRLTDIVHREIPPEPWAEGEKIPWSDPAFSVRMLAEHLSQEHDRASRRTDIVGQQVDRIERLLPPGRPANVLDLGCGPGLHALELTRRGHRCTGIDCSPASIQWARSTAEREGLDARFVEADIREAEFGDGFDLVMFLYGEMNVFRDADLTRIVEKARAAMGSEGVLLLETHRPETVERLGTGAGSWRALPSGLFSDRPHLLLEESFWDADRRTATTRYFVVDAASGQVTRYAQSVRAHHERELDEILGAAGFPDARTETWPGGGEDFLSLVARPDVSETT